MKHALVRSRNRFCIEWQLVCITYWNEGWFQASRKKLCYSPHMSSRGLAWLNVGPPNRSNSNHFLRPTSAEETSSEMEGLWDGRASEYWKKWTWVAHRTSKSALMSSSKMTCTPERRLKNAFRQATQSVVGKFTKWKGYRCRTSLTILRNPNIPNADCLIRSFPFGLWVSDSSSWFQRI